MNADKLRQLAEHIRKLKPGEYNQGEWYKVGKCGTEACLAGHTALMEGAHIGVNHASIPPQFAYMVEGQSLPDYAAGVLGLDEREANNLFGGGGLDWPDGFRQQHADACMIGIDEDIRWNVICMLEALAEGSVVL
jgi:hypothetical protein